MIQVKRINRLPGDATPPLYCRAWVTITRSKKVLREFYYADIDPVGDSYGLFVPKSQPSSDYFVVIKLGDYDGRLLLIHKDGTVLDLPGEEYFTAVDEHLLFVNYASDISGLTVFDLMRRKILINSAEVPYVYDWYRSALGYFFTESEWLKQNLGRPTEKAGVLHLFDLDRGKIVERAIDRTEVEDAEKVRYDFSPSSYQDCTCDQ